MERGAEVGERAPDFTAVAAGSGWEIGLEGCAGRVLVLIFHQQSTVQAARDVNQAVRESYPSPEGVLVASVIDLSIVPPPYRPMVSPVLDGAYQQAIAEMPSGVDPAGYVVILPDWDGEISHAYGARGTGREAAIVVIDESSKVAGAYQGGNLTEVVLQTLEELDIEKQDAGA